MSASTSVKSLPYWLVESLKRLEMLSQLPANWDSYGAKRVKPETLGTAMKLLGALEEEELPVPHLTAGSAGTIQIEWQVNGRFLELEIIDQETIEYLKGASGGPQYEGCIAAEPAQEFCSLVAWLLGNEP